MSKHLKSWNAAACGLCAIVLLPIAASQAANKSVDLDKNGTNESNVALDVTTSPVTVTNTVTNKAVGVCFQSNWPSAAPGGWISNVPPGTTAGVGVKWKWQSSKAIYSFTGSTCANDICFTQNDCATCLGGTNFGNFCTKDADCPGSTCRTPLPIGTAFGAFRVPGRSLSPSGVSLSNASLTTLGLSFFSPPTILFGATSSVGQGGAGELAYSTRLTNQTNADITFDIEPGPPGCCPEENQLNCEGTCVDYLSDPDNCGGCGIDCNEQCSSGYSGCGEPTCHYGSCDCGYDAFANVTGTTSECEGILSARQVVTHEYEPELPLPAPLCMTAASTVTIPAGGSQVISCDGAGYLAEEVATMITVCPGGGMPDMNGVCSNGGLADRGPFMQLVPDLTRPIGTQPVILTPGPISVEEPTGTGQWLPGTMARLNVSLYNVGSSPLTGVCATLVSPPQDLDLGDEMSDLTGVTIVNGSVCYPDLPGVTTSTTDCTMSTGGPAVRSLSPFKVQLPADHLGDTSRIFILRVTGMADGMEVSQDVPFTVGIAGRCDPSDIQGDFDGLDGLHPPMARLIPEGDPRPLPLPNKPFQVGRTIPAKLSLSCGGCALGARDAIPPQIVGLFDLTRNVPVDINKLNICDFPNSNSPFFRAQGQSWIYNIRTRDLRPGRYRLTIQVNGQINYVTGFELRR